MKQLLFLLFCSSVFLVSAQKNELDNKGRKHGAWVKYYDTRAEKIRYEGEFNHGAPVKTFTYYYPNGNIEFVNVYRGETGTCYSKQFDEKNNIMAEGLYANRLKDSTWTFFGLKQQLLSREDFKEDKLNGWVIVYFPEGQIAEKTEYVEGVKNGAWQQKYGDGKLKAKGTYKEGSLEGEVTFYNFDGRPFYKGTYRRGLKIGTWYTFERGKVTKKETFESGKLLKTVEY